MANHFTFLARLCLGIYSLCTYFGRQLQQRQVYYTKRSRSPTKTGSICNGMIPWYNNTILYALAGCTCTRRVFWYEPFVCVCVWYMYVDHGLFFIFLLYQSCIDTASSSCPAHENAVRWNVGGICTIYIYYIHVHTAAAAAADVINIWPRIHYNNNVLIPW